MWIALLIGIALTDPHPMTDAQWSYLETLEPGNIRYHALLDPPLEPHEMNDLVTGFHDWGLTIQRKTKEGVILQTYEVPIVTIHSGGKRWYLNPSEHKEFVSKGGTHEWSSGTKVSVCLCVLIGSMIAIMAALGLHPKRRQTS